MPNLNDAVESVPEKRSRNQEMLDRRQQIADSADDHRREELMDVDGETVVGPFGDSPEEREARAAAEEAAAAKLLAEGGGETDEQRAARELQEEGAEPAGKTAKEVKQDEKSIDGVTYYLTIVNGKEKWMTMSQMRAHVQKVDAADEYLKAAKESVTNASRLALSATDEPNRIEEADLEATLNSAILGDEGAIKKLAQHLKAKPSAVTPDVLHAVDEHLGRKSFAQSFKEKHKEIFDDPESAELFHDLDAASAAKVVKEGIEVPLSERLESVAERVKKIRGAVVPPKDDKQARKAAVAPVPSAAGRKSSQVDEDAEESTENVIAQMAKSRGSRAIRH